MAPNLGCAGGSARLDAEEMSLASQQKAIGDGNGGRDHPLAEGIETCPECGSPVVNVDELIEHAAGDESAKSKKAKSRKTIVHLIDMFSLHLVGTLLIGSIALIYHVLSLSNEKWTEVPGISTWLAGYSVAVLFALIILFRINRKFDD